MPKVLLAYPQTRAYCGSSDWAQTADVFHDGVQWSDYQIFITHTEYDPSSAQQVIDADRHGLKTIHIADGLIEWRNTFEHPPKRLEDSGTELLQPILSKTFAALGSAQIRTLRSWGNSNEIVPLGAPRFQGLVDSLTDRLWKSAQPSATVRILITSARTFAFRHHDTEITITAYKALRSFFSNRTELAGRKVELIWRIGGHLSEAVGLSQAEIQEGSGNLTELFKSSDLLITSPSTLILEGMLHRIPVILYDWTGSPSYINAAWKIGSEADIEYQVLTAMNPCKGRICLQEEILADQLRLDGSATDRLTELVFKGTMASAGTAKSDEAGGWNRFFNMHEHQLLTAELANLKLLYRQEREASGRLIGNLRQKVNSGRKGLFWTLGIKLLNWISKKMRP